MTPAESTRVWRKTQRKALRGVKTGRRSTHAPTPPARSPWQGKATARAEMEADFAARNSAAEAVA